MDETRENVNALVSRLERHQELLGLSDAQFSARYQRYIGSATTWRVRLIGREWAKIGKALPKWEARLRAFVAELDGAGAVEDFCEDLPIWRYASLMYERLASQTTDRRCFWLVGPTGIGKSATLRRLYGRHVATSAYIRANETWKKTPMQMMTGFARALGTGVGGSAGDTLRNILEHLSATPMTVMVDEAHDGGVHLLKMLRTAIDETGTRFVVSMYHTKFARLLKPGDEAYTEAQQLLGRSVKPLEMRWAGGCREEDVAALMRGAGCNAEEARAVAGRITPLVRAHGNLRLLADAIEDARIVADEHDEAFSAAHVEEQVAELCMPRNGGKEGRR